MTSKQPAKKQPTPSAAKTKPSMSPFGSATAVAGITKDKKGNVVSALFPETKKAAGKKKK